jgi:hypothetical protein
MISMIVMLAATVAALGAVIWSGAARRRALHYKLIVLMLVCLGVAIWRAEVYGASLVFEGLADTVRTIHFVFVALTFLCLPVLLVTGLRLARAMPADDPPHRAAHHNSATAFALLVLVTTALGVVMTVLAATPA